MRHHTLEGGAREDLVGCKMIGWQKQQTTAVVEIHPTFTAHAHAGLGHSASSLHLREGEERPHRHSLWKEEGGYSGETASITAPAGFPTGPMARAHPTKPPLQKKTNGTNRLMDKGPRLGADTGNPGGAKAQTIHHGLVLVGSPCFSRKAACIKHCSKGEADIRVIRRHTGVCHIYQ